MSFESIEIGKVAKVMSSKRIFAKEYVSEGIPFYRSKEVGELCRGEEVKTELFISKSRYDEIKEKFNVPEKGDMLLTAVGSIGNTWIVDDRKFYYKDGNLTQIKPSENLDVNFLNYFFKSNSFWRSISSNSTGTAYSALTISTLNKIKIPLPPLETQKLIAQILDDAAALRDKTAQLLKEYDLLAQSIFLDMFGDPSLNVKNWEKKKCGEYISYLADIGSNGANKVVSKKLVMTESEDYALMIRTTNFTKNDFKNNVKYVSKEVYDFFKKSQIFGGEIIMNKIGSAGDFWLMPKLDKPVSLGLNQFVIRLENIETLYFYYFLSTDYGRINIKSRINGVATKSITKTAVRDLPILVPPIKLQKQFAEKIALIEQQKALAKQELQESEDLFNCLLQKAFKGELV
ncbi:MAG: restriction endonuclease subunit S [Maribacter arcticus]|uniref:restriction endonuclease subunit S n=1 Tax=Maribacter arcticus TaxID=561365 RepID=UPI0030012C89